MEAWDSVEIVVDRIQPYNADGAVKAPPRDPRPDTEVQNTPVPQPERRPEIKAAGNGAANGNGTVNSAALSANPHQQHDPEIDNFAPLPVTIEVKMDQTTKSQLSKLASTLEHIEGNREVQMVLHEISGDIRRVKLDPRFAISDAASEELAKEFPFITFMDPHIGGMQDGM